MSPTVSELLRDHVTLSISSIDRLYINGYIPRLQNASGLHYFFGVHRGMTVISPALFKQCRERFVNDIKTFADEIEVPIRRFYKGQRKDDIVNKHRKNFEADEGVVFIGVAQERCSSFKATKISSPSGFVSFDFYRQPVFVNHYYFYLQDLQWGPALLKIGSYFPFPLKLVLNGHEWAKQQARYQGLTFQSLDNGFRSCDDPQRLQEICDSLEPRHIQDFFDRWSALLPWPLSKDDRIAGYNHKLTIWQLEASLTQVFDKPLWGRRCFDQLIRDNLDLGRPERVSLLFPNRHTKKTPPPKYGYRTRVITRGVHPSVHFSYKSTDVKQYLKEEEGGAGLRTETTSNNACDFGLAKGIDNLDPLRQRCHEINLKLLETQRVSSQCVISQTELDAMQQPTQHGNQRASALRFGENRTMALLFALCLFIFLPGFRNRDMRRHVASYLGVAPEDYKPSQMTYDLRRLRLKGLIERQPGTTRYHLTPLGNRVAYFHTKVFLRLLRPAWAAFVLDTTEVPRPLREAFKQVDKEIAALYNEAGLRPAA